MLYGMMDIGRNVFGMSSRPDKLRKGEFWAVDNLSFELNKGETFGIIGPNGSGKTTLLKMLNGIFWPDKGKISIRGKVGALIAVGAGFHPMLTGRENISINAAIIGMTKRELERKFDDIVEFAEIGDFLDSPVKFYSSGMYVRLGFAVAVHCEPDLLLVDEVLAVGDVNFQNKCLKKMQEILDKTTVIFVSHNMNSVRLLCNRCLALSKGKVLSMGDTSDVINVYLKHAAGIDKGFVGKYKSDELELEILDNNGRNTADLVANGDYTIRLKIKGLTFKKGALVAFSFVSLNNNFSHRVEIEDFKHRRGKIEELSFDINFSSLPLPPGNYNIRLAVSDGDFLNRIYQKESTINFNVMETEESPYLSPKVREINIS